MWNELMKMAAKDLDIKSISDLQHWMFDVEYGWMDKDYKKHDKFGKKFWNNYRMLLPDEVAKYKVGVCWDQTVFENWAFDKYLDYEHKMVFIQQFYASTHTFLIYKKDSKWYHFENSFDDFRGNHGPYDDVADIVKDVYKKMLTTNDTDKGYDWSYMKPKDFEKKLTCEEFLNKVKYDWGKQEKTDWTEDEE